MASSVFDGRSVRRDELFTDIRPICFLPSFPPSLISRLWLLWTFSNMKTGKAGTEKTKLTLPEKKIPATSGSGGGQVSVTPLCKLQAPVYDILPSTTAVFSYAIGSRKLPANEQFFVGAQTVIS